VIRDPLPPSAAARRLAALLLLGAATAAAAQGKPDEELCASVTNNPDLAIQHCTRAIDSKRFSGMPLARLHYNRGLEHAAKGRADSAIADYDAAIRLDPRYGDAYLARGNAWGLKNDSGRAIADFDAALNVNPKDRVALGSRAFEWTAKGDYARAIADQDAVIRLDPKSSLAWFGRGRARFYSGDLKQAIADLREAIRLDPNSYTAIWLYLARKRAGIDADDQLESGTADIHGGGWPWPIVALYVGRTDVDSVMAAATNRDATRQRDQRCEANFYVAHWHLMRNERDRALALFKTAESECPRDFMEHEGAVAELRRLAK
jgi:lipoprotein NlpI